MSKIWELHGCRLGSCRAVWSHLGMLNAYKSCVFLMVLKLQRASDIENACIAEMQKVFLAWRLSSEIARLAVNQSKLKLKHQLPNPTRIAVLLMKFVCVFDGFEMAVPMRHRTCINCWNAALFALALRLCSEFAHLCRRQRKKIHPWQPEMIIKPK